MTMSIYAQNQNLVQRANTSAPLDGASVQNGTQYGLGTEINRTANRLKAVWNFAVLGGATGNIGLLDDQGNAAILPLGALVVQAMAYVVTAPVGSGGSIGLNLLASSDLMAQTAITSLTTGVLWNGKPQTAGASAAFTAVGPVVAKLGTQLNIRITAAALTAGLVNFYVDWVDVN